MAEGDSGPERTFETIGAKEGFPIFLRGDASDAEIANFAHEAWLRLQRDVVKNEKDMPEKA